MSKLLEVVKLGEDATLEEVIEAYEKLDLVPQSQRDEALKKVKDITNDKREADEKIELLEGKITILQEGQGKLDDETQKRIDDLEAQIKESSQKMLKTEGIALLVEAGYGKDEAETLISTIALGETLENVENFISLQKTREEQLEKKYKKDGMKFDTPDAPEKGSTEKKLREQYDALMADRDIMGVAEFRENHPQEYEKFTQGE